MSQISSTPSVPAVDLTTTTMKNGEWYAFDLKGRRFYAIVNNNGFTGHLELTEIPDPYICAICGMSYLDGEHEHTPESDHDYLPRGAP